MQKVSDDDTKEISNSYESAMVCITSHSNQRTPFNDVFMYTTTKEQFINQNYVSITHTNNILVPGGFYKIQVYYDLDLDYYESFANIFQYSNN